MIKPLVAILMFFALPALAQPLDCISTPGLAVDADGAPDSYRVDGKGLSYTCDGVFAVVGGVAHTQRNDRTHWQALCQKYWEQATATHDYSKVKIVGFQTNSHNVPVVQGAGDPLPGQAFITTTAARVTGAPSGTQRQYVDASEIPYVVLPTEYLKRYGIGVGDLVAVYRPLTRKLAYGVYGDCCSLGEASVRLHQDLGNDPIVTIGGVRRAKHGIGDKVFFVALSGAHTTPRLDLQAWRAEIKQKGDIALAAIGGLPSVAACRPHPGLGG